MQIGILGPGNVGSALAGGLAAAGHEVVVGSRTPDTKHVDGIEVRTQQGAADHGDLVVLALPANAVVDVATSLQDTLAGKPVIDTVNEYPTASTERPIAARIAAAAPEARLVKAFNTIGANRMTEPVIDGEPITMFLAGDDAEAVDTVRLLADELGFEPVLAGDLSAASHLEHLARFWIHLSREFGRDIAFRFLQENTQSA